MVLNYGKPDLDEFIKILNSVEGILSKLSVSFYKHHNSIPVVIGQQSIDEGNGIVFLNISMKVIKFWSDE